MYIKAAWRAVGCPTLPAGEESGPAVLSGVAARMESGSLPLVRHPWLLLSFSAPVLAFSPDPAAPVHAGLAVPLLGAGVLCLGALAVYLARVARLRAREAAALGNKLDAAGQALAVARDEIEARVAGRTAELRRLNEELRTEIEARTSSEESLRASEERYRELFDSANDLVFMLDLDGNFVSINKAAQRITGYTQEEALGLNLPGLVVPEDLDFVRAIVARHLAGERSGPYEVGVTTKSGTRLALELNTHLVFRDGMPEAVQGIARDVTERKRLEEELRHSQKMEAIGRLAGGLAHDLNNLLTVVGAYSQMISDEVRDAPHIRTYAEEILAAAERAGALTGRLLAFSRRQMLQPQVLNLNRLVVSMDNMLRRLLGEDVELRIILDSGIGAIKADPNQIEQVVMNLAINGRDAMPRGGRLTIETAPVEFLDSLPGGPERGAYVKLTITDTGIGMSPDILDHMFEPFFTTKPPGKGTGLGLSTVYGIVKQSGGDIFVDSRPAEGSTFMIYFPHSPEPAPAGAVNGYQAIPAAPDGRRGTILVVEDEPGVRRLVCRMLAERGYRVMEAAGGEEALALCERERTLVDLVLTDMVMPAMSGSELAERLLALHPELKILYMTGYSDETLSDHGLPSEFVPVLKKPFLPGALEQRVRELLES